MDKVPSFMNRGQLCDDLVLPASRIGLHSLAHGHVPEISARERLRILWRRKSVIIGTAAVLIAISGVVISNLVPHYRASAQILIIPPGISVVETQVAQAAVQFDHEVVVSEARIIQSRHLAERVIDKLSLDKLPEFNPDLAPISVWRKALDKLSGLRGLAGLGEVLPKQQPDSEALNASKIVDEYQKRLEVVIMDQSRVIEIRFTADQPAQAQQIVNAHLDMYVADQLESKLQSAGRTTAWLQERLGSLRGQVESSERAAEAFRAKAGLMETGGGALVTQQLSNISTQLLLASAKRSEAEATLRQVEALRHANDGIGSVAEVMGSPLIRALREQEAQVLRKQAELSDEYGSKHPKMISVQSELDNTRAKINGEMERIVRGLQNEVAVAKSREQTLRSTTQQLETKIASLGRAEVDLRSLEREAGASRAVYESFLARFKILSEQNSLHSPDVRIVSNATLPASPSSPPPQWILWCSAVFSSVALGMVAAGLVERFDAGFRSQEQIERELGLPAVGLIPGLSRAARSERDYVSSHPYSAYTEGIRSICIGLRSGERAAFPKVLLVSSAVPGEGKTSLSLSLAQFIAKAGKRVILVDCDFRRPRIHTALGIRNKPGLAEVLSGEIPLEQALHKDRSGVEALVSGSTGTTAMNFLGDSKFENLIARLRAMADVVIMDSAPLSAVGDTRVLSLIADKTLFLVRWASTRRETAIFATTLLRKSGATIAGVALTRVDIRKHAEYGFGDSGFYHGVNKKYYLPTR